MTGAEHVERRTQGLPPQLNQDLKKTFQSLPDFSIFYAEPGTEEASIGFLGTGDSLDAQLERRKRSQTRPILQSRFQGLLAQSHLTRGAQAYLRTEFDTLSVTGLERDAYPVGVQGITELEYYTRLFGWDDEQHGGVFDPQHAQDADRALYRRAVREVLADQRTEGFLAQDEGMKDLLKKAQEAGERMRERVKEMSAEELDAYNKAKSKEDEAAHELISERRMREQLIREWREEYTNRYGDEP